MGVRIRRMMAGALLATMVAVGAAIPQPAASEVPAPTIIDALCRKDLHKTTSAVVKATLAELARCHKKRVSGDIPPGTDCNDVASALSANRVGREQDKVQRRAETSCNGGRREAASPPSVLGFSACPAPCDAVVIGEDYNGVADCLICLANVESESTIATVYGAPALPVADAASRCMERVGTALQTYVSARMKFQEVCQTEKDQGDLPLTTDCRSYDPNGRIAAAEATLTRKVETCGDAALALLDSCGTSVAAAQTCVAGAGRDVADAIFDAVYPPIPGPPTLTPTATATPPPTPTPDSVDCVVSDWSDYNKCSKECGGGTQTRTRTVVTEPVNGGAACPALEESVPCNEQPCPVDCVVSDWGAFNKCSKECGGGTQTRTRTVLTFPANGGKACPALEETVGCNQQPCPVDCVVSSWGSFSACTKPCGGGTQTRTRTVLTFPANGGKACPALEESVRCNEQPCPVDCMVSDWSAFSECSVPCGGGTQTRTRTVLKFPANGGVPCPQLEESVSCNEQPCLDG